MPGLEHDRFCDEIVAQTEPAHRRRVGRRPVGRPCPPPPTGPWPTWSATSAATSARSRGRPHRHGRHRTRSARSPVTAARPATTRRPSYAWLSEAAGRCAATLREAGPDAQAQVWTVRWPTAAWARRAAHDLVVHRADAAGTVGAAYTVAPDLAADALDEFLDLMSQPQVAGGGGRRAGDPGPGGTVHLHATDTGPEVASEWLVELASPGFTWRHAHDKATVAVRGPIADVLRVAYRRLPPDAEGVEVLGDRALLDAWLERLVLR